MFLVPACRWSAGAMGCRLLTTIDLPILADAFFANQGGSGAEPVVHWSRKVEGRTRWLMFCIACRPITASPSPFSTGNNFNYIAMSLGAVVQRKTCSNALEASGNFPQRKVRAACADTSHRRGCPGRLPPPPLSPLSHGMQRLARGLLLPGFPACRLPSICHSPCPTNTMTQLSSSQPSANSLCSWDSWTAWAPS